MKIAFVGNFTVPYSSESHYLKTFQKLGHEVVTIQENRPLERPMLAANCDILFWVHTHGWETPGLGDVVQFFKDNNKPIVGYHLDLWLGIEREKDLKQDNYWKSLDYFFCTDRLMVDYLNEKEDMPNSFFLPAGVFEDECYMAEPDREKYPHDIIFVGSRGYHPEWPYRPKLIKWLEDTYGDSFAQYGGGGLGTIRGADLNTLYASAKIAIGDTLCKGFNYPYYFSDRLFEAPGRGAFPIFPYIKGIEDQFEIHNESTKELVTYTFNNFEELKNLIDFYLSHEDKRRDIRLRGFKRTVRDHTYTNRLSYLLDKVKHEQSSH